MKLVLLLADLAKFLPERLKKLGGEKPVTVKQVDTESENGSAGSDDPADARKENGFDGIGHIETESQGQVSIVMSPRRRKPVLSGQEAQEEVLMTLKGALGTRKYRFIEKPVVKGFSRHELAGDIMIVSQNGLFLVDIVVFDGEVFGTGQDAMWTVLHRKKRNSRARRSKINNPIRRCANRAKTFANALVVEEKTIVPAVVVHECGIAGAIYPENCGTAEKVAGFIASHRSPALYAQEVAEILEMLKR